MYRILSNGQSKQFIDSVHILESLLDAKAAAADYRGGMHWKTIGEREYLYRTTDRHGNAKSLGPRSEKTEKIQAEFVRRKFEITQRVKDLKEAYATQTRMNAAVRLGAVPNQVADVLQELGEAHLLGKTMMVIGTNAMHAYEAMGGVRFDPDMLATVDVDLLWNHHSKLSLGATEAVSEEGLIGILKRADKTYEIDPKNPYRARSSKGFMVDLIRQMPDPPWSDEPDRFFESDLVATDVRNMRWLLNAPHVTQPVVAVDGRVLMLTAPDPRAFALFKIWLSGQPDREPLKRGRDLAQARAVIQLIEERLPHLNNWGALHSFPNEIFEAAASRIDRMDWPGRG